MLPRELRLPRSAFRGRKPDGRRSGKYLTLSYFENKLNRPRFGIILTRGAARNSVERHRLLRRLRSELQNSKPQNKDYILKALPGAQNLAARDLHREVLQLLP